MYNMLKLSQKKFELIVTTARKNFLEKLKKKKWKNWIVPQNRVFFSEEKRQSAPVLRDGEGYMTKNFLKPGWYHRLVP